MRGITAMQVIRAEVMGMCFGVRDALQLTGLVDRPDEVTIHGELVHNATVLADLDARGFRRTAESDRDRLPDTPRVLITAHGMSQRRKAGLAAAGKDLIDTTCPLVRKVHDAARRLEESGHHVVVIGRRGHVEVQGIVEDLDSFDVISGPEEVRSWPHDRIGIVCQTTASPTLARDIAAAVEARNPHAEVHLEDTICEPTRQRGAAVERLLEQVEALVVVGGHNSNNTRQLVARAAAHGVPAHHVAQPGELRTDWFAGCGTVGLTAGTSTPDDVIDAVYEALVEIGSAREPA